MSKLNQKYTDDVIVDVAADAQYDFWQTVAKSFPEIANGDFDLGAKLAFDNAINIAIEQWLLTNQPPEKKLHTVNVYRTVVQRQTFTITEPSEQDAINRAIQESQDVYDEAPYWDEIGTPIITKAEIIK